MRDASRSRLSAWKLGLFAAVTLLVFFGALEGLLALFGVRPVVETEDPYVGFVQSLPLFAEEKQPDGSVWRVTAPNKRAYFNPQRFPATKGANTYRVFCLGGSTTYGHPYDDRTSFAGWMREILPAADPSRTWEVVNAGGVSYASYRVAALMEELVHYEPDLFVVYTGQNEFLERRTYQGLIDANPAVNRLGALAGRTRTYSAVRRVVQAVRPDPAARARKSYEMSGEVDALLDAIGGLAAYSRDDTLRLQIESHYEFNSRRMVRIARAAGAGIVFVVPASNLRDCSPFKSQATPGASPEVDSLFAGRAAVSVENLERAATLDPRRADVWYALGQAQFAAGDFVAAEASLQRAIDEDVCPLRQSSTMRKRLHNVTETEGVPLVDFVTLLADSSRARYGHRVLGEEFFLDHVHPTIEGNRLLAIALVQRLVEAGVAHVSPDWSATAVAAAKTRIEGRLDRRAQATGLRNVARVFNWAGKTEEAGRLARQALELDPGNLESLVVLGSQAAAERRPEDAIRYFEEALAADPNQLEARNNLAAELSRAGKYSEALAHYEEILRRRSGQWAVHSNAAHAYAQLGQFDRAAQQYEQAMALRPNDVGLQVKWGDVLLRAGKLEDASSRFESALRLDAGSTEAHVGLGRTRMLQGKPEEALGHFRDAVTRAPESAPARLALATLLWQRGDLVASKSEAEAALRLDSMLPEAHNVLGLAQWRLGDIESAIASFAEELRVNPAHADARENRAFILAAQGRVEEAIGEYRQALKQRPDEPKTLNGLAWLRATHPDARHRDGAEALDLATRADRITGHRHPVALNTLAAALAENGRFEDAVRAAEAAVRSAREAGQDAMARDIESMLALYRAGKPFRDRPGRPPG